jgi:hypothetical protein
MTALLQHKIVQRLAHTRIRVAEKLPIPTLLHAVRTHARSLRYAIRIEYLYAKVARDAI